MWVEENDIKLQMWARYARDQFFFLYNLSFILVSIRKTSKESGSSQWDAFQKSENKTFATELD
jgi:hypothetical protein